MPVELPCPALFVTGTDTGVGKTIVAAALARFLTVEGLRVGVMKPVETGVEEPAYPGGDAQLLAWAAGATDPDELIAPCRLKAPVAPTQAAEIEGTQVDPGLLENALSTLARDKDFIIIEGAGGLMVPVRGGFLMADLVKQFNVPLLIVARTGLGTLNHTLLTVYAAQTMGIKVAGILLNGMEDSPDLASREAPHLLAMLASADLLGVLPKVTGDERHCIETLAGEISRLKTLGWLLQSLGVGRMDGRVKR
jgi:dethiobiotin synthetase